jgi:hypothetical protein
MVQNYSSRIYSIVIPNGSMKIPRIIPPCWGIQNDLLQIVRIMDPFLPFQTPVKQSQIFHDTPDSNTLSSAKYIPYKVWN